MLNVYVDDLGTWEIPQEVLAVTQFTKTGKLDGRSKNQKFNQWLAEKRDAERRSWT